MTIEQLVVWIVIGGIAGLLADALVKDIRVGLVGAILIGILGAFIGGWLFSIMNFRVGTGFIADVFTAFVGSLVLLVLLRALRRL